MGYVNEFASDEDVRKYGLEAINKRFRKVDVKYGWTIDREKNVYLRWLHSGREDECDENKFLLCWEGELLIAELKRKGDGVRGGPGWTHWSMINMNLPSSLEKHRQEILKELKQALAAFKDFGARSVTTEHTATFDF